MMGGKFPLTQKYLTCFFFDVSERLSLHLPPNPGTQRMVGQRGLIQPRAESAKRENVVVPHTIRASESLCRNDGPSYVCVFKDFPVIVCVIATTRRFLAIHKLDRGMPEWCKLQRIDREVRKRMIV
jgi:hypothetical protein